MVKRGPSWPRSLATTQALWFPALQDVADNTIISSAQKFPGWGHLFCSYASINRSIGIFRADVSSWYFLYPAQVALLKVYRWTSLSIKAFIPGYERWATGKGVWVSNPGRGELCKLPFSTCFQMRPRRVLVLRTWWRAWHTSGLKSHCQHLLAEWLRRDYYSSLGHSVLICKIEILLWPTS